MSKTTLEILNESMIPTQLLAPQFVERAHKAHHAAAHTSDSTPWEDWGPNTKFKTALFLRAKTFKPMPDIFGKDLPIQFGDWRIFRNPLPKTKHLRMYQANGDAPPRLGWAQFDRDIKVTVLTRKRRPIMGLTPMECISVKAGARFARGSVVITGLGIGYLLYLVCQRRQVKNVTVIEDDPGIIEHVWPRLKPHLNDPARVRIITGDCNEVLPKFPGTHDVLLADHFSGFGYNKDWLTYHRDRDVIREKFKKIWIWG